jgi:ABC-type sugar transport system permease subunit
VVTSAAVVAVVIRLMLGNFGTGISELLNIRPALSPIASPQLALLSVIAFGTWHTFGINLIYFIAALQTVPEELYDAAKVDGANWLQQIMYVTIPGIRPVATIILFFAILGSLRVFEASFVLTGGGPYFASEVVSGYIFGYAFSSGGEYGSGGPANLGYASAAAFFFSILILGITLLQLIMTRRLGKATEDQ